MKTTEQISVLDPFNPPEFWDEAWMKAAVKELELRAMTRTERFAYEKALIKYRMEAYYTEELKQQNKDLEQQVQQKEQEVQQKEREIQQKEQEVQQKEQEIQQKEQEAIKAQQQAKGAEQKAQQAQQEKDESIAKMLTSGLLTDAQIAEFQNVPLSRVQEIKRTL